MRFILGLITLMVGVDSFLNTSNAVIPLISILLGGIIGSIIQIEKKLESIIPSKTSNGPNEEILEKSSEEVIIKGSKMIDEFKIHDYIRLVWEHIGKVNKYFNDSKPWELEKSDKEKFLNVLAVTTEQIRNIAFFINPIMPQTSIRILQTIGIDEYQFSFKNINAHNIVGNNISKVNHLFTRIQE